jgi:hypothetical protein
MKFKDRVWWGRHVGKGCPIASPLLYTRRWVHRNSWLLRPVSLMTNRGISSEGSLLPAGEQVNAATLCHYISSKLESFTC